MCEFFVTKFIATTHRRRKGMAQRGDGTQHYEYRGHKEYITINVHGSTTIHRSRTCSAMRSCWFSSMYLTCAQSIAQSMGEAKCMKASSSDEFVDKNTTFFSWPTVLYTIHTIDRVQVSEHGPPSPQSAARDLERTCHDAAAGMPRNVTRMKKNV